MNKTRQTQIIIKGINKSYQIGERRPYQSLRESLWDLLNKNHWRQDSKKNFIALNNINLKIKHGEILGIIGRNGAGKSTLLKLIARITYPDSGTISIKGRVGSLLEVGTGFHPELTGRENIYLNGSILGMKRAEIDEKFAEIVKFSEIESFLDTPVKRYSSGMYVRLAFSVAAHLNPEILLIDEVLAVGDIVFQNKCLGKIKEVTKSGRTVIFISHNIGLIKSLCDRVVLLDKGKIIGNGRPDKIIQKYIDLTSRGNFGSIKKYKQNKGRDGSLISITIVNEDLKPCTRFRLGEKAYAILKYQIYRDLVNSDIGIMLSQAGQTLWIGLDNDAQKSLLLKRPAGIYCKKIPLPTHYLLPGLYHIGPSMGFVGTGAIDNQYFNGLNIEITSIDHNHDHRIQRQEKGGFLIYIREWTTVNEV